MIVGLIIMVVELIIMVVVMIMIKRILPTPYSKPTGPQPDSPFYTHNPNMR